MDFKNIVKENESKIEKFDFNYYLKIKNYAVASALSALETTNEIQKSYFKPQNTPLTTSDYILKLYALLQGLFVSIDSLYDLAISLTKSKNFININNNKDLRQLKYIRNDVVGHPSSRIYNHEKLAYCILDNKSITLDSFSYSIYTKDEIKRKDISINELLTSYYEEANNLLDELYRISCKDQNKTELEKAITIVVEDFFMGRDYTTSFDWFISTYNKLYPTAKKQQHRVLWRVDLIKSLNDLKFKNDDERIVIDYCKGLELLKIYKHIFQNNYKLDIPRKIPKYIQSFYKLLNKNKYLYPYLNYLKDTDHPLFFSSIMAIKDVAVKKKYYDANKYLQMIIKQYESKNLEYVYALALPIKEYKRK